MPILPEILLAILFLVSTIAVLTIREAKTKEPASFLRDSFVFFSLAYLIFLAAGIIASLLFVVLMSFKFIPAVSFILTYIAAMWISGLIALKI